jgi:hypothetical protein
MAQNGQLQQTDFFDLSGGLNSADSPFSVKDSQATDGANFEYPKIGALSKRGGHEKITATPLSPTRTRGMAVRMQADGTKSVLRFADSKAQLFVPSTGLATDLSEDASLASTAPFTASATSPITSVNFASATQALVWTASDNAYLTGVYSDAKWTKNGVAAPVGAIALSTTAGGGTLVPGAYWYAVSYKKNSTNAESNVALDQQITVAAAEKVVIDLTGLTPLDTTRIASILIYRSAIGGSEGFTSGDIIAELSSATTTFTDDGTGALTAQSAPRANSVVLDNSSLAETNTYSAVTVWKRCLVTASGPELFISDVNKPESWPTVNRITLPNGGPIVGLDIISFNTEYGNDEYLAIFQERQLWLFKGSDYTDFSLSFIDAVGAVSAASIVRASGVLLWVSYAGIYMWDGSDKPILVSKPINDEFSVDGVLDKSKLDLTTSMYSRKKNQAIWYLSHKIYGEQKYSLALDLRLTMPNVSKGLAGRVADGVFLPGKSTVPVYGAVSYLTSDNYDESLLGGDASGNVYKLYNLYADAGAAIEMIYATKFMDMGNPNLDKRFTKVVVWVEELGNWDMCLDYWSGYRSALADISTLCEPISTVATSTLGVWDLGQWDVSTWDDYSIKMRGVVFNLHSGANNSNEGDALKLRIRQSGADEPLTVFGYSVFWMPKGLNK